MAACGAPEPTDDGRGADTPAADVVLREPAKEPAEPESIPYSNATTQIVYVNFDGQRVDNCSPFCSDAPANRSTAIGQVFGQSFVDFAPYANASGRQFIVQHLAAAFADYNVAFTTVRPAQPPYTMLIISPTTGPHHGVAPLNCDNTNRNDIAFVYSIGSSSVSWIAQAGAHELGHSFGLAHVTSHDDYMQWASAGDDFTVASYDTGHPSGKCFEGSTQDAPAMLYASVGHHPFDGAFADDDGNIHEANIDAIAAAGVTHGCGHDGPRPIYCPAMLVTRAQMAAFLTRALSLPPAATDYFDDDNGSWYEPSANALAQAGVTVGCGQRKYCGDEHVTRAQMAVFLDRALSLPPASGDYFDDDSGSWYEPSANRLYEAGITKGCGTGHFCGDQSLPRDQMASFLARALGL